MERELTDELAKFAQQQLSSAPTLPSGEPNLKLTGPGEKFDIYKVDYKWIELQSNKRELKLAYQAVKEDGGFPDLLKAIREKLKVVDPSFKTTEDFNNYTSDYAKEVNSDVLDFLRQAKQNDDKLRDGFVKQGIKKVDPSIFTESSEPPGEPTQSAIDFAAQIEKKRLAEEKRLMGNESMKSKDYDDAIEHYSRSLELSPDEPATFSNRAMAYLQKKSYAKAIEDANSCLAIQPDYLKAFHRRGKAYQALNKFDLAIKDYQYILERSPEDKGINAALKECRQKLESKLDQERKLQPEKAADEKPKGFRRVAIAESDSDEENHNTSNEKPALAKGGDSSKPAIEEIGSSEQSNWWQRKENNYSAYEKPLTQSAEEIKRQMEELKEQQAALEKQAVDKQRAMQEAQDKVRKAKEELATIEKAKQQASDKMDQAAQQVTPGPAVIVEQKQEGLLPDKDIKEVHAAYEAEVKKFFEQKEEQEKQAKKEPVQISKADDDRKAKLRPKFEKLKEKVEAKKEQAAADFKKGLYAEAINLYKAAATSLDNALEDFGVFKREIAQMEAAVFGNIAFCYGKDKQDKQQIEYCTKVIDRSAYIEDASVLTKAFLRRGLAYEHCEKFKLAANDLTRVKQLDPMNKQARDSLARCLKCIKQDEGIDYIPEGQEIEVNTSIPAEDYSEVSIEEVKITVADEKPKTQDKPTPQPEPVPEKKQVDFKSLLETLTDIKEKGNLQFKKKSYKEAIKHFSEGVKLFEEYGRPMSNEEVKTVITQIYTNRSLAFHSIDQQNSALADANFVIENLDNLNAKALFRRVHAFRKMDSFELAVRDLETLVHKTADGKAFTKELEECRKQLNDQRKRQAEELKAVKVKEVTSERPGFKKVAISEDSDDSDDKEEVKKLKATKKTKQINQETLKKAQDIAIAEQTQSALNSVPKTAAGFVKDLVGLKRSGNQQARVAYLRNIPAKQIETYFKNTEIEYETLSDILEILTHDLASQDDCLRVASFMQALAKADGFELTISFFEEADKKRIESIFETIKQKTGSQGESVVSELQFKYCN